MRLMQQRVVSVGLIVGLVAVVLYSWMNERLIQLPAAPWAEYPAPAELDLETPVTFEVIDAQWPKALQVLAATHGISVAIPPSQLAAFPPAEHHVTLRLEEVPFERVLDLLLKQVDPNEIGYYTESSTLHIDSYSNIFTQELGWTEQRYSFHTYFDQAPGSPRRDSVTSLLMSAPGFEDVFWGTERLRWEAGQLCVYGPQHIHRKIAHLSRALNAYAEDGWGTRPVDLFPDRHDRERLQTILAKRIDFACQDEPLHQLLNRLAHEHGLQIHLHREGLLFDGIEPDSPISIRAIDMPLKHIFAEILAEEHLKLELGPTLVVQPLGNAPVAYPAVLYPVEDLLTSLDIDVESFAIFLNQLDVVQSVLQPSTDGDCIHTLGDAIAICGPRSVHLDVERALGVLRNAVGLEQRAQDANETRRADVDELNALLAKDTTLEFLDVPLRLLLEDLRRDYGLRIWASDRLLRDSQRMLISARLEDEPLEKLFLDLAREHDRILRIDIDGGHIILRSTTEADRRSRFYRAYYVGDLLHGTTHWFSETDLMAMHIANTEIGIHDPISILGDYLMVSCNREGDRRMRNILATMRQVSRSETPMHTTVPSSFGSNQEAAYRALSIPVPLQAQKVWNVGMLLAELSSTTELPFHLHPSFDDSYLDQAIELQDPTSPEDETGRTAKRRVETVLQEITAQTALEYRIEGTRFVLGRAVDQQEFHLTRIYTLSNRLMTHFERYSETGIEGVIRQWPGSPNGRDWTIVDQFVIVRGDVPTLRLMERLLQALEVAVSDIPSSEILHVDGNRIYPLHRWLQSNFGLLAKSPRSLFRQARSGAIRDNPTTPLPKYPQDRMHRELSPLERLLHLRDNDFREIDYSMNGDMLLARGPLEDYSIVDEILNKSMQLTEEQQVASQPLAGTRIRLYHLKSLRQEERYFEDATLETVLAVLLSPGSWYDDTVRHRLTKPILAIEASERVHEQLEIVLKSLASPSPLPSQARLLDMLRSDNRAERAISIGILHRDTKLRSHLRGPIHATITSDTSKDRILELVPLLPKTSPPDAVTAVIKESIEETGCATRLRRTWYRLVRPLVREPTSIADVLWKQLPEAQDGCFVELIEALAKLPGGAEDEQIVAVLSRLPDAISTVPDRELERLSRFYGWLDPNRTVLQSYLQQLNSNGKPDVAEKIEKQLSFRRGGT